MSSRRLASGLGGVYSPELMFQPLSAEPALSSYVRRRLTGVSC